MGKPVSLVDISVLDVNHVIADRAAIRHCNLQRYEMELLTAVIYENLEKMECAGYLDVSESDFWVRGHIPQYSLMPGVIICECAAQLASYFVTRYDMMNGAVVGFGGLTDVKFRGIVRPGDRLVLVCKTEKVRRLMMTARFEALVKGELVAEGLLKGVALPLDDDVLAEVKQARILG